MYPTTAARTTIVPIRIDIASDGYHPWRRVLRPGVLRARVMRKVLRPGVMRRRGWGRVPRRVLRPSVMLRPCGQKLRSERGGLAAVLVIHFFLISSF